MFTVADLIKSIESFFEAGDDFNTVKEDFIVKFGNAIIVLYRVEGNKVTFREHSFYSYPSKFSLDDEFTSIVTVEAKECVLSINSDENINLPQGLEIDEWLDRPCFPETPESYAKFVIEFFRRPAWQQSAFNKYMKQFKLFCMYEGKKYRVTGASRLGDVFITDDMEECNQYTKRVNVLELTDWSNTPDVNGIVYEQP